MSDKGNSLSWVNRSITSGSNKMTNLRQTFSRRGILVTGFAVGAAGVVSCSRAASSSGAADEIAQSPATVAPTSNQANVEGDIAILNAAIDLENQGIWAYGVAGGKLTNTQVGTTILALAQRNRADHVKHRDALIQAVQGLGGTPAPAKESYDLSSYLNAGEGNLDSDANIGKLALALEIDAVLAYNAAFSQLSDRDLLMAASTIGPVEACHATAIRAVFRSLTPTLEFIPTSFISAETRQEWILKV
jgi:hypothetical protein